eukprot:1155956-Pelagomonas_calceolata.AAC.15
MASEMQLSGRVCGEPGGPRFPCSGWATFAFLVFSACSHSGMLSTALVMIVLKREFATPDEEMKKIVLKVVKQCVSTEGVESDYIKTEILPEFFKAFWVRRMALDSCGPPGTSCLQGLPGVAHLTGQASSACVAGMPMAASLGVSFGAHLTVQPTPFHQSSACHLACTTLIACKRSANVYATRQQTPSSACHLACTALTLADVNVFTKASGRNYRALVETTVSLADKVGCSEIVGRVVEDLKDESEPYRRMVMETIEKVVSNLGSSDIDARLEELLIDGILYAFQEQACLMQHALLPWRLLLLVTSSLCYLREVLAVMPPRSVGPRQHTCDICPPVPPCFSSRLLSLTFPSHAFAPDCDLQVGEDAHVMLNGFGTVVNSLGKRAKPYLPQVCGTIKWRLNNKSAKIRQQAADLIARIAPVMKACDEEQLLGHLGSLSACFAYGVCEWARDFPQAHGCFTVCNADVQLLNY